MNHVYRWAPMWALCICLAGLTACTDKKAPLKGERVALFDSRKALGVSFTASREKILFPENEKPNTWTQPGGNACKAWFPLQAGALNRKAFQINVGASVNDRPGIIGEPIVAQYHVYTVDANAVIHAVNYNTGKIEWKSPINPEGVSANGQRGGVVFDEDTLYAVSAQGHLVAIEPTDGTVKWRTQVEGIVRSVPTVDNGRILVVTASNKIFAYDFGSGKLLWSHEGVPEQTRIVGNACPAIYESVSLVPYGSGELYAFRVENGYLLWSDVLETGANREALSTLPHIKSNPVIDFEKAFVVSHGGPLVAFDVKTGERVWEKAVGSISTPFVTGNSLFIVTTDNYLACLSRNKGGVRWIQKLPEPKNKSMGGKGRVTWYGPVVLSGGRIVVNSSHGEMLIMSAMDGEIQSRLQLPGPVDHGPVIANKRAYFVTQSGKLVVIE